MYESFAQLNYLNDVSSIKINLSHFDDTYTAITTGRENIWLLGNLFSFESSKSSNRGNWVDIRPSRDIINGC